ncbi:MAG: hypothetical protein KDA81_20485 [Planctomycetaceae bacterium]|nr:hypothetical protein [Planctomycetaceae bacterium]
MFLPLYTDSARLSFGVRRLVAALALISDVEFPRMADLNRLVADWSEF